jgi:hypothetical protein
MKKELSMTPGAVRMRAWLSDPANRARSYARVRARQATELGRKKHAQYSRKYLSQPGVREHRNALARKRWAVNGESRKRRVESYRKWHSSDLEKHRQAKNDRNRATSMALRSQVFALYGGTCMRCGFADERALQLDHIKAIGTKARIDQAKGGPASYYRRILKDDRLRKSLQLLCANCNWIKRCENQEHKKRQEVTGL